MGKFRIMVRLDDEKWLSNINFCIGGNWLWPYYLITKAMAGKYATALDKANYLGRYGERVIITIKPRLHSAVNQWQPGPFCQITLASCHLLLLKLLQVVHSSSLHYHLHLSS